MRLKELLKQMGADTKILENLAFDLIEDDLQIPKEVLKSATEDKIKENQRYPDLKKIKLEALSANFNNVKFYIEISVAKGGLINILRAQEILSEGNLNTQRLFTFCGFDIFINQMNQLVSRKYFSSSPKAIYEKNIEDCLSTSGIDHEIEKIYLNNGLLIQESQISGFLLRNDLSPTANLESFNRIVSSYVIIKREPIGYIAHVQCIEYKEATSRLEFIEGYVQLDLMNLSQLLGRDGVNIDAKGMNQLQSSPICPLSNLERKIALENVPIELKSYLEKQLNNKFKAEYTYPVSFTNKLIYSKTKKIK